MVCNSGACGCGESGGVQALSFGDRLGQLKGILNLVGLIDWKVLLELSQLLQRIAAADSLKEKVRLAMEAAKLLVNVTPNEVDNAIVGLIEKITANDEVLDLVIGIVEQVLARAQAQTVDGSVETVAFILASTASPEHEAKAIALGIDWDQLRQLIVLLVELLQLFK